MEFVAYLDPGSGSLIAATAAAGLAGVSVAAKSIWHRRTARFRKGDVREDVGASESEVDEPTHRTAAD